jgi:hypothetical protein
MQPSLPHILIDLILRDDCFIEGLVRLPGPGDVIKISPLPRRTDNASAFRQRFNRYLIQTLAGNTSACAQRGVNGGRDASYRVLHA